MQSRDVGLAESVRLFEEGMALVAALTSELDTARAKVRILIEAAETPVLGEFPDGRGE
jgi:exodeoxyribonuclease VII small subunit